VIPNIATAAPTAPAGIWRASPPSRSLPSYANGVNGILFAIATATTETSHFLVVFQPSNASLAKKILDSLEEARETLTVELGVEHDHPLKVKLIPHLAHQGLARYLPDRQIMEVLTEGGLTRTFRGQLPPEAFIEGVLWHEYVHFLQHQLMKRFIKDRTALWLIEGTAESLGTQRFIRPYPPGTVWTEGKAMLSGGRLPTLAELNRYHMTSEYPIPTYFFSADAVTFLIQTWGMASLQEITRTLGTGKGLSECLKESLDMDVESFEDAWHRDLETRQDSHQKFLTPSVSTFLQDRHHCLTFDRNISLC